MSTAASADLILQKPVALLNRTVNINYKELFVSLGKIAMFSALGEAKDVWENVLDSVKAVGLAKQPEEIAWLLISRSLTQALSSLVEDYRDLFRQDLSEANLTDLAERVEHTLNAITVCLDARFFENPRHLPLLDDFKSALIFWLTGLGLDEHQAQAFHYRLSGEFVLALHEQWGREPTTYAILTESIQTPFTQATLNQRSRWQYNAWLQQQANARVFNEAFGLRQVYIPLRAYYVEQTQTKNEELKQPKKNEELKQPKRMVCDLHQEIENWLRHFDKDDAIRVISGGPGCGKSTFSKILAADLAEADEIPVLFIPLHHFSISEDLHQAIAAYVQQDPFLRVNPLDAKEGERRLLVIFDGLDELSMQGKAADMVARDFVDEVIQTLYKRNNYANTQWQVLITGRDLAVQANETRLRKPKQILHMLPYFITEHERNNYIDDHQLLNLDQRHLWWDKFTTVKGLNSSGLPAELATEHLEPITAEPLLNYLVALSYERKQITFNEQTRLNTIYYDLLKAVYDRQYAGCQHQAAKQLSFDEFLQVLEEIALAVWHGNGRTATESYLIERCRESHLTAYLERFAEDAKKGVVRLLTAFYFRQFSTENNGDRTFEFTHKSFGEYLSARRIIGAVETIVDEITRHQQAPRKGWNTETALLEWIKICGKTRIDNYVERFIKEEIAQKAEANLEQIKVWQRVFLDLVVYVVHNASPMEKLSGLTFQEMLEQSNNAENALMLIHSCCAQNTQEVITISSWVGNNNLRDWLARTQCKNLNFLHLEEQILVFSFLFNANLSGANLMVANLMVANLSNANLSGADLSGADLRGANLNDANLSDANLSEANLSDADLRGADLRGADLRGANLNDANLSDANLSEAYLLGADLRGANLRGADLSGANLSEANLREAKLRGADLSGADLRNTILEGKDWRAITGYQDSTDCYDEETLTDS